MIGVQRGLDVHVLDRVVDGPKPQLIADLGATYHHSSIADIARQARPDVVIEATGVGQLVFDAIAGTASYGMSASPACPRQAAGSGSTPAA
jgi:glucose 1-dehydrogenase